MKPNTIEGITIDPSAPKPEPAALRPEIMKAKEPDRILVQTNAPLTAPERAQLAKAGAEILVRCAPPEHIDPPSLMARPAPLLTSLLLSIALLSSLHGQAQTQREYRLAADIILRECSISGDTVGMPLRLCPYGAKFTLVKDLAKGAHILSFFDWVDRPALLADKKHHRLWFGARPLTLAEKDLAYRYNYDEAKLKSNAQEADRYFIIQEEELKNSAVAYSGSSISAIFGTAVLPFKYRPSHGVVTKDVSLSGIGGIRFNGEDDNGIALCFGAAISAVTLDSLNTGGEKRTNSERAALTIPIGIVVDRNRVQFGVFAGWDWLFDDPSGWRYQGKPWFGLAVGMSVFTQDIKGAKTNK